MEAEKTEKLGCVEQSTSPWGGAGDPAKPMAGDDWRSPSVVLDGCCAAVHSALVALYSQNYGDASVEYTSPHLPS